MLGSVTSTKPLPPSKADGSALSRISFGSAVEAKAIQAAATGAKSAAAEIANIGFAEKIFKTFGKLNMDVRKGGLSLEDMAARTLTIFGVYLPQGVMAVREDRHKWETNGRNAVVWLMTLGLTWLLKNERWGLNTLLDRFMHAKRPDGQLKGVLDRAINPLRLQVDYFDILEKAGIAFKESDRKVAFWSKLDANKLKKINNFYDDLKLKAESGTLQKGEKAVFDALPGFIKRLNVFPMIATTLITAATVYLIGDVAMRIVYKFIAPFDHDFDPSSVDKTGKKAAKAPSPALAGSGPAQHIPSFQQPPTFRAFSRPGAVAGLHFGERLNREGQRHV